MNTHSPRNCFVGALQRCRQWLARSSLPLRAVLMGSTVLLALPAQAEYPDRPIRLIVPYAAGGSLDITARLLAERLKNGLGQTVVVENVTGASGNLGTQTVARAAPDGYTVLIQTMAITINPWLFKTNFDAQRDLMAITRPAAASYMLAVSAEKGPKTFDEFLALAKADPGKLACATYGVGSPPHLALEMLKQTAGVDIMHVPYRGFGLALPDVLSGQLACGFDSVPNVIPHVRSGKLRAMAITGSAPSSIAPGVPTMTSKFPGLEVIGWQGIFVPAKTPKPVAEKLHAALMKALHDPEVEKRLAEIGFSPLADSMQSAAAAFKSDYDRYGQIIRARNIQAD